MIKKIFQFTRKYSIWILLIFVFALCTNGIYKMYHITSEDCTSCGKCKQVCPNRAIILDNVAYYNVLPDSCKGCGKCLQVCEYDAIHGTTRSFHIDTQFCTHCGDCKKVCEYDAITIPNRTYEINQNICAKYNECGKCLKNNICPYGALYKSGNHVYIDQTKCKRCGNCLTYCAEEAEDAYYVTNEPGDPIIDQEKCVRCGKCELACVNFTAISNSGSFQPALVDQEKCQKCGKCYDICPNSSILPTKTGTPVLPAQIDQKECLKCGKCVNVCPEKAIKTE
mgnify:CR=1 FL=1